MWIHLKEQRAREEQVLMKLEGVVAEMSDFSRRLEAVENNFQTLENIVMDLANEPLIEGPPGLPGPAGPTWTYRITWFTPDPQVLKGLPGEQGPQGDEGPQGTPAPEPEYPQPNAEDDESQSKPEKEKVAHDLKPYFLFWRSTRTN